MSKLMKAHEVMSDALGELGVFRAKDGTMFRLDEVIAIREPVEDYRYVEPFMYTVITRLGTQFIVGHDSPEQCNACYRATVAAWEGFLKEMKK